MTSLPDTVEARAELVFDQRLSPQKDRLLRYLLANPDAWTHELAANCAVGYPPNRLGELNKETLPRFGLHIRCHRPETWLQNRYGESSQVHQWRIESIPIPQPGQNLWPADVEPTFDDEVA